MPFEEDLRELIANEVASALEEFSGAGAVAGYALPLGANPADWGAPPPKSRFKRMQMTASKPYGKFRRRKRNKK